MRDAGQPLGDALDGLAAAQARQHLLPELRLYQGGKDLVGGALPQAQVLDFVAEVFFRLADGDFVDALGVLLRLAAPAGFLAVALQETHTHGAVSNCSLGACPRILIDRSDSMGKRESWSGNSERPGKKL
jgi:hypothetical protein